MLCKFHLDISKNRKGMAHFALLNKPHTHLWRTLAIFLNGLTAGFDDLIVMNRFGILHCWMTPPLDILYLHLNDIFSSVHSWRRFKIVCNKWRWMLYLNGFYASLSRLRTRLGFAGCFMTRDRQRNIWWSREAWQAVRAPERLCSPLKHRKGHDLSGGQMRPKLYEFYNQPITDAGTFEK